MQHGQHTICHKEVKEGTMPDRRSKSAKEIIISNMPWIVTTLLAIGAFVTTVKYQGEAITANAISIVVDRERIITVEKSLVKVEAIQSDIAEIKSDIKEIKHIVLRPAIANNLSNISDVQDSLAMRDKVAKIQ